MTKPSIESEPMSKQPREEREAEMVAKRNSAVLEAALALADEGGIASITRDAVALRAGVSTGTVNNAYGAMVHLRHAVMCEAINRRKLSIIAQGLAAGSEVARSAPPDLKEAALATLTT